jgi:hypothetical protein
MGTTADLLVPAEQVLLPRHQALTLGILAELRETMVEVWSATRFDSLAKISESMLRNENLRREPAAVALAYWLRRSNLLELRKGFPTDIGAVRVPAGLVFHVTPANVDTMFVYSWALSFLAGNANIVRLTTRLSPLMQDILAVIDQHVSAASAGAGNWFVSYDHDENITGKFSAACDLRIVWGGDETVRRLRAVPLNPHAAERSFASKRSCCVIDAAAYVAASPSVRQQIAAKMSADIAPFGQMACSSPHQVFWLGERIDFDAAVPVFRQELDAILTTRGEGTDIASSVRRLNSAFSNAAQGSVARAHLGHASSALEVTDAATRMPEPCGAGQLVHACCAGWADVAARVGPRYQTVTHFGLEPALVVELASTLGRAGVDRVVPIGEALSFGPLWDGFALWTDLTRGVVAR